MARFAGAAIDPRPLGIAAGLAALALALRLPSFTLNSLWLDELHVAYAVGGDLSRLFSDLAQDVHPPLFSLLTFAWVRWLGLDEVSLRLLAVVLGTAVPVAAYLLLRAPFGERAAVSCGLVVVCMPAHVVVSQEVRPYGLALAGGAILARVTADAVRAPGLRTAILFGVGSAGLLYLHYAFVPVILAGVVAIGATAPGSPIERLRQLATATVVMTILLSPWGPVALRQLEGGHRWIARPSPGRALEILLDFVAHGGWLAAVWLVLAAATLVRMPPTGSEARRRTVALAVLAFMPMPIAYVISSIPGLPSLFDPKLSMIFCGPLLVAIAVGVAGLGRLTHPLVAVVLALELGRLITSGVYVRPFRSDNRGAAAYVAERARELGEILVIHSDYRAELFDFYLVPLGLRTDLAAWDPSQAEAVARLIAERPNAVALVYVAAHNRPGPAFFLPWASSTRDHREVRLTGLVIHEFALH